MNVLEFIIIVMSLICLCFILYGFLTGKFSKYEKEIVSPKKEEMK